MQKMRYSWMLHPYEKNPLPLQTNNERYVYFLFYKIVYNNV